MALKISKWIPLESNPDVLNNWSIKAGVDMSQFEFTDVYGLDFDALAMVPQPVKAVVLLFPYREAFKKFREEENQLLRSGALPSVDPNIIWMRQTISNACGTIGLLHALINSGTNITPDSALDKFISIIRSQTPEERARTLEETPLFADIHAQSAQAGQSAVPTDLETDYHFTCFVLAPSTNPNEPGTRLVELDGTHAGPVDRGACDDLLEGTAHYVKEKMIPLAPDDHLNMMALAPPLGD